jgi:hypothetical protein
VDPTKLETYLTDEEFYVVFRMTRQQFYALKDWQIRALKIKKCLW